MTASQIYLVVFYYDCGGQESPQAACTNTAAQSNFYTNPTESVLVTPGLTRRWQTETACIDKVITVTLAYHTDDPWSKQDSG